MSIGEGNHSKFSSTLKSKMKQRLLRLEISFASFDCHIGIEMETYSTLVNPRWKGSSYKRNENIASVVCDLLSRLITA